MKLLDSIRQLVKTSKDTSYHPQEPGWLPSSITDRGLPLNRWQGIGTVGSRVRRLHDKRADRSDITVAAFHLVFNGGHNPTSRLACWARGRVAKLCLDQLTPGCQVYVEGQLDIHRYTLETPQPHRYYDPRIAVGKVLLLGRAERCPELIEGPVEGTTDE